jgi:flavorubredoxin
MGVSRDIKYIGVNDNRGELFEGQYEVPQGISYNSYVIMDDKIAVMDTVDVNFTKQWLSNLELVLSGRTPDYLIVQHMEPDHSASIAIFMDRYPETVVVASAKAFAMMKNFFGKDYAERRIVVADGSILNLGKHELTFYTAMMVHWPEVIVTYDATDKVLFSADAFGKFGTKDIADDWVTEARRYYIGIVGRYGQQVQNLLQKVSGCDIQIICPLHGPVLSEDLGYYLGLYQTWSSYEPEKSGVVIAYATIYGNTRKAAELLAEKLRQKGCEVIVYDLARCDMHKAVADAFCYDRLVLASSTYNADVFPYMKTFIQHLTERQFQNRKIGLIENGSWAPLSSRVMRKMLETSKNLTFTETTVKIFSAMKEENVAEIEKMCAEFAE